jgi:hypothetical protein
MEKKKGRWKEIEKKEGDKRGVGKGRKLHSCNGQARGEGEGRINGRGD